MFPAHGVLVTALDRLEGVGGGFTAAGGRGAAFASSCDAVRRVVRRPPFPAYVDPAALRKGALGDAGKREENKGDEALLLIESGWTREEYRANLLQPLTGFSTPSRTRRPRPAWSAT